MLQKVQPPKQRTDGDSTIRPVVTGPMIESRPTISPNGRWIAYMSDESGRQEIYVRPFPDAQVARWQVTVGGGSAPRWSRNGRELFFLNERIDMFAVPVTLAPTFGFGTAHRLFAAGEYASSAAWGFDVGASGRFLMSRPAGGGAARADEVILVQNFFEELKAKMRR